MHLSFVLFMVSVKFCVLHVVFGVVVVLVSAISVDVLQVVFSALLWPCSTSHVWFCFLFRSCAVF